MARTQAVTILFCDLVKSTERRARLGDDAFDAFTGLFMGELRAAIAEFEGREVSSAGDGLMVVFPDSVADGLECAASMHRRVALLDADDPPRLRIGISCGEVAQEGNEYSGMPIVEAARLEASAEPGKTLANAIVRSLVGTRRAFRFRDVGALSLKGIPEPLATIEIVHGDEDPGADAGGGASPPSVHASGPGGDTPASRPRRRALVAGAVVVLVVVLVAAGIALASGGSDDTGSAQPGLPTRVGYSPKYEEVTCPNDVKAAAAEATCGHLVVPQDRSKPTGKQVTLLVTRAPPRIAGKTGAPSIDLCGCENVGNSITRDHSELVQMSTRGFPGSEPTLDCPEVSAERTASVTKPANDPDEIARGATAFAQCHDRLVSEGVDPGQYNYQVAAQDVLDLMLALHIDHADFTASDLVSAELFEVVRRAPAVVRSITIDNPAAPGITVLSDPVGDLSDAFGRFVAQCEASTPCAAGYPDLAGSWRDTYARYQANPRVVAADDPDDSSAPPTPILIDGPRAADALAIALADASTYKVIPPAITSRAAEQVVAGEVIRSDPATFHPDSAPSWGTLASYLCAYDVHTVDTNAIALETNTSPQFTRAWASHWTPWCRAWNVPDVSAALSADVVSPVPALLFRGELTAIGSQNWLHRVQRGLSRDQTVTFPTLGSGLLANGPPCLSKLRREFLADPTAKLDTAACSKQSPPIPFVAPG